MKKEIIIYKESIIQSFINDLMTFGFIVASYWFNYQFIGDSNMMKGILLVIVLLTLMSKPVMGKFTFTGKEDAIKHLNEL